MVDAYNIGASAFSFIVVMLIIYYVFFKNYDEGVDS